MFDGEKLRGRKVSLKVVFDRDRRKLDLFLRGKARSEAEKTENTGGGSSGRIISILRFENETELPKS